MATTENFINGDTSTILFSFSFPYLKTEDVRIELQEIDSTKPTNDQIISTLPVTAFIISSNNPTQVQFSPISGGNNYQTVTGAPRTNHYVNTSNTIRIRIYRVTASNQTPATLFAGSAIRAQDLNVNFDQSLYLLQENQNTINAAIQGTIADGAITTSKIADNAVTTDKILNSNVTEGKLASNAVTTNKILNLNVTSNKLASDSVTESKILTNAVTTSKIADSNVTTAKIADDAVTLAKLADGVPLGGNRNLIINGGMDVAQRGTSVASLGTGQYLIDRFKVYNSDANSHTITQSQSSDVPSNSTAGGFTKALKLEVTSGAATPADGWTLIAQPIEGFNSSQLKYGTFPNAKTVTLSFWARTNAAGTYSIILRNDSALAAAQRRNFITEYTLAANTWTYVTETIPGDTVGTWYTDNSKGLEVMWALDVGDNYQDVAAISAWQTGATFGASTDTNTWSDTTGNTFELTGVQLEVGSSATPFEHENYGQTLTKCQRYYYRDPNSIFSARYSASNAMVHVYLPTTMRDTPSTFVYTTGGLTGAFSSNYMQPNYCRSYYTNETSVSISNITIDAEL